MSEIAIAIECLFLGLAVFWIVWMCVYLLTIAVAKGWKDGTK
jgi:hypothetical protein